MSIVMAVCNGERYLREAVDSIVAQTFSDYEFIIINDGSTDRTLEMLEELSRAESRIHVVSHDNIGLTKSLNAGLALARGDFVARMDADDISMPRRFEAQLAEFERSSNLVLLGGEVELISEDGFSLGPRRHPLREAEIRRRLLLGDGGALTHPVVMYRRATAMAIGGYDERFVTAQDLDLFIRLAEQGGIANLRDVLLKWRQHGQSVNRTQSETWATMKRMAVRGAIERMGIPAFLEALFPYTQEFLFPDTPIELAHFAMRNGRLGTAAAFLRRGLSTNRSRGAALRGFLKLLILLGARSLRGIRPRFQRNVMNP